MSTSTTRWRQRDDGSEELIVGKFRAVVRAELDAEDPRPPDKIGTVITGHSRYEIGDVHCYNGEQQAKHWQKELTSIRSALRRVGSAVTPTFVQQTLVRLPVYMLDHSGLVFSLEPFHCPWDSGQIGEIYARLDKCRKKNEATTREDVERRLRTEFEAWKAWKENDIHEYVVFEDGETVEQGVGYLGYEGLRRCRSDARKCTMNLRKAAR